jgi:hypothetical protein
VKLKKISIGLLFLTLACEKAGEEIIPDEPHIVFDSIRFAKGGGVNGETIADTVVFTFQITDGDENFGLDHSNPVHSKDPFQDGFYVKKSSGELVSRTTPGLDFSTFIKYSDRSTPPYDTLPSIQQGCYANPANSSSINDYLYFALNKHNRNIHLAVMVRGSDGSFRSVLSYVPRSCGNSFSGVIPSIAPLDPGKTHTSGPFRIKMTHSRKGVISYHMSGLWIAVANYIDLNEIKVVASVEDRDLNESNTIESPLITIE